MKRVDLLLKWGTAVACLWEAAAIPVKAAGGPDMTISHNVDLHWWVGVPILGGLGLHFYWRRLVAYRDSLIGG